MATRACFNKVMFDMVLEKLKACLWSEAWMCLERTGEESA